MNKNRFSNQGQKILPIRKGMSIHKDLTNIKPFFNLSSTAIKLQKKKTANTRELNQKRKRSKDLLSASRAILNVLQQTLAEQTYAIFLTDDEGYIIEFRGDEITLNAYRNNEFNLGFDNHEQNLNNDKSWPNFGKSPVIVEEVEYYTTSTNGWTCCGVPIRNPEEKLIGLLEIAVPGNVLPPHALSILECVCQTIELEILELRKSNAAFGKTKSLEKLILESLPQTVIALDEEFNLVYMNNYGLRFFNLAEQDYLGRPLQEVLLIGEEFINRVKAVLAGETGNFEREVSILIQERILNLSFKASKLLNKKGKLTGFLLVIN